MPAISEESNLARRKRKRKALSCLECRRRKVKCDRRYPCCNRCRETGDMGACIYTLDARVQLDEGNSPASIEENEHANDHPLNSGNLNTPTSTTTASRDAGEDVTFALRTQARKIAQLESRLANLEKPLLQPPNFAQISDLLPSRGLADFKGKNVSKSSDQNPEEEVQEMVYLRGKGFKTEFNGASSPISLLAHLPELGPFLREVIAINPATSQTRRDLKVFTEKRKKLVGAGLISGIQDLLFLVPPRDITDLQVKKYLDTLETAYHILHVPSFLKEYNAFWEEPSKARYGFVPLLLLLISTVSCLCPLEEHIYIGDSSRARELALRRIEACDAWIERQSLKHVHLTAFQLRCLSLLGKQMNQMRMKAYFTSAGTLLRAGMTNGLHRNPAMFPKKQSPFNQEMRKRIFATMMELELQASIDFGLPSQSASLPFDCPPPSNLNDEELSPTPDCHRVQSLVDETLPTPCSTEVFTQSSYLHLSGQSLSLRIHINTLINDHSCPLTYPDILILHDEITSRLNSLPHWPSTTASALPRLLLDVQLRQFLLHIHAPFATQRKTNSRTDFSRTICMNTAACIISQHATLIKSGYVAANHLRNDVLRAALALSHNVFLSTITMSPSICTALNPYSSYEPLLQSALALQTSTVLRLGRTYQDYYRMSGLHGLVMARLSQDPESADMQKMETTERGVRIYRQVLENQELAVGSVGADEVMAGGLILPSGMVAMEGTQQALADSDMQINDYEVEDVESWTWDSFWPFEATDQGSF